MNKVSGAFRTTDERILVQAVRRGAPSYDEDEEVPLDARPSTSTVGCPLNAQPISPLSEVLDSVLHSMAPSKGCSNGTCRVGGPHS